MKKLYGPFFCINNLWHWNKACYDFPKELNAEAMVSTVLPKSSELCNNCLNLDKEAAIKQLNKELNLS